MTDPAPHAPWMLETLQQGLNLLNAGQPQQAMQCAQRVLSADDAMTDAHFLVGLISLSVGQPGPALDAFGRVTRLAPRSAAAWSHIARILVDADEPSAARIALAKAIKYDDNTANVLHLIAQTLSLLGDHREALPWFEKVTTLQPLDINARANHANCLAYVGRMDDAQATLTEALRIQPAYPNAHWLLAGLRKAVDRTHVDTMQRLINMGRYAAPDLAFMHYACGKELEDLEQWDDSFTAFAAGAAARRRSLHYDEPAEIALYEALQRIYTDEWLAAASAGHQDLSPIFVVGQPRTGTTLVERIITAHPQIESAGELRHFTNCLRRLTGYDGQPRISAELVERAASVDFATLGRDYVQAVGHGSSAYFVDKLPSNFLFVPLILKALPNAKVVHLRRHPVDTCFANFKQLFAQAYPHSYVQEEMARHYARYYHLMSVWRERFGDRYHELEYEGIVNHLEVEARALVDFLGLPWDPACLAFQQQTGAVATASAVQVRQPLHNRSIGRWRHYADRLQPTLDILREQRVPIE